MCSIKFHIFVVLILCFGEWTLAQGERKPIQLRILGGKSAKFMEIPYQVAIFHGTDLCGGSIISSRYILSAAHCFTKKKSIETLVGVGSHRIKDAEFFVAEKVILHPHFDKDSFDHDIAIVKLAQDLTFGPNIDKVNLPKKNSVLPIGKNATISGWGRTETQDTTKILKKAVVPIIGYKKCRKYFEEIDPEFILPGMICAGFYGVGGVDTCQGDSGGPLVYNDILYGITSHGIECGRPTKLGVYTDVRHHLNFIKLHTKLE